MNFVKLSLEIREKIKSIYYKIDAIVVPVLRFLVALILLSTINSRMGYMTRLDSVAIVLITSLACSFLPGGAILLVCAVFTVMHMYAVSLEVMIIGIVVYLIIYLLFMRFAPKESLVVALTALLMCWKIPYMIPLIMGLIGGPASALSVACGVLVYTLLHVIVGNAANVSALGEGINVEKMKLIIDALIANKNVLVVVVVFAIIVIVVYVIRRLPIRYSWVIAIATGTLLTIILMIVAEMKFGLDISTGSVIGGSLLAAAVGLILMFFRFCVDANRTERVQFEDDEYYYYVTAVPKLKVPTTDRKVKKINNSLNRVVIGRFGGHKDTEETYYEDEIYSDEEYYEEEDFDEGFVEEYEDDYEEGGYDGPISDDKD